jgi:hypothetical protein
MLETPPDSVRQRSVLHFGRIPPHCGFGWGYMNNSAGAIRRGGDADTISGSIYGAGVFSANLNFPVSVGQQIMGFRCSFQP